MARSLDEIAADFDALQASNFDLSCSDARGMERLRILTDDLLAVGAPDESAEIMLGFIERVMADDLRPPRYDFGSPGPLVQTIEKLTGYETHLVDSLRRQPAPLSVWMLNRIINATQDTQEQKRLLNLLRDICSHPNASPCTREEAAGFLRFQEA